MAGVGGVVGVEGAVWRKIVAEVVVWADVVIGIVVVVEN